MFDLQLIALAVFVLLAVGLIGWSALRSWQKAQAKKIKPGRSGEAYGFTTQYLDIGGETIHFARMGRGPELVLLHGIGASLFIWRFLIQRLAQHFTVTALDLPGFGRSQKSLDADYGLEAQADRLIRFFDRLGINQAYLVGSSMGGTLSLLLAKNHPQRFQKVAALAPATNPSIVPRRLARILMRAPLTHKTLTPTTMRLILTRVISRHELIVPETVEAYLEPYLDQGVSVRTFLAAMELLGDPRLPACFSGLEPNVLLLYGAQDRLVSAGSLARLQQHLQHSNLVVHPTAGHHMMEDDPDWTFDHLLEHFENRPRKTISI